MFMSSRSRKNAASTELSHGGTRPSTLHPETFSSQTCGKTNTSVAMVHLSMTALLTDHSLIALYTLDLLIQQRIIASRETGVKPRVLAMLLDRMWMIATHSMISQASIVAWPTIPISLDIRLPVVLWLMLIPLLESK